LFIFVTFVCEQNFGFSKPFQKIPWQDPSVPREGRKCLIATAGNPKTSHQKVAQVHSSFE
jgi:hypothetical protein